jgi:hypothetical protein
LTATRTAIGTQLGLEAKMIDALLIVLHHRDELGEMIL